MPESEMAFSIVDYVLLWVAVCLAALGTSFRVYLGMKYSRMIDEVDQMTTTKNRELKRCKVKYEKCYAMNKGVANVGAFVDRFLSKLSLGPFPYLVLYQMGAQLVLLAVIFMALLICHRILEGDGMFRLIPYYAGCFAGLYVFLAISVAVNVQEKRRVLKISLVDYLENHLTPRLGSVGPNLAKIRGEAPRPESSQSNALEGKQTDRKPPDREPPEEKEIQVLAANPTQPVPAEQSRQYQELSKLLEEFFAI